MQLTGIYEVPHLCQMSRILISCLFHKVVRKKLSLAASWTNVMHNFRFHFLVTSSLTFVICATAAATSTCSSFYTYQNKEELAFNYLACFKSHSIYYLICPHRCRMSTRHGRTSRTLSYSHATLPCLFQPVFTGLHTFEPWEQKVVSICERRCSQREKGGFLIWKKCTVADMTRTNCNSNNLEACNLTQQNWVCLQRRAFFTVLQ